MGDNCNVAFTVKNPSREMVERGATQCLEAWAAHHGWADGDWSRHLTAAAVAEYDDHYYCDPPYDPPDSYELWCVAAVGHLAMLRLLHERGGCPMSSSQVCAWAANVGSLE